MSIREVGLHLPGQRMGMSHGARNSAISIPPPQLIGSVYRGSWCRIPYGWNVLPVDTPHGAGPEAMENSRVVDLIVDGKVEEELLGASLELVEVVIDKPVARDWSSNIAMRWAKVFALIARATWLRGRLVGQGEGRRVKHRPEEGAQPRSK